MKTHDLVQGSPEWLAYRANHFNASDAPAMMGCSPYKTRAQLLRELHTGRAADVDVGTQKRFDNGHRAEALARPLAEEFIGEELYPVTGSLGRLSASFDGLTLDESTGFEHKALNAELRAIFERGTDDESGSLLPIYHRVQMEQQLLISGAQRILFMSSAWTADEELVDEKHCWYYPDLALRQSIVDGWAQFERDLAAYALPASDAAPAAVGKAPETLPALRIEISGAVTASNLAEFKETALGAIRSVNRSLHTDQDFADAEKAIKWCGDVESRLAAAKEHALSQTADIDALFKTLDEIADEAKRTRLALNGDVTRRKAEVKDEAVLRARRALADHVAALNTELHPARLTAPAADFAGAIKGRRSVTAMQDALDALLAQSKIEADAAARLVRGNLAAFRQAATGFEFLFADLGQVAHKAVEDFTLLVSARIAQHQAAEQRKREEAERRQQEAAARAQQQREQEAARQAEAQRLAGAAVQQAAAPVPQTVAPVPPAALIVSQNAPIVSPAATPAPRADEPATLKLGDICARLGFTVTAAFVGETLHVRATLPTGTNHNRHGLYTETQFRTICTQLLSHVGAMAELYAGEPA